MNSSVAVAVAAAAVAAHLEVLHEHGDDDIDEHELRHQHEDDEEDGRDDGRHAAVALAVLRLVTILPQCVLPRQTLCFLSELSFAQENKGEGMTSLVIRLGLLKSNSRRATCFQELTEHQRSDSDQTIPFSLVH